jgi:hypothetical protein
MAAIGMLIAVARATDPEAPAVTRSARA